MTPAEKVLFLLGVVALVSGAVIVGCFLEQALWKWEERRHARHMEQLRRLARRDRTVAR